MILGGLPLLSRKPPALAVGCVTRRMDVENTFTYHPPKADQPERYEAIRSKAKELAELIELSCPTSREKIIGLYQA